MIGHLYTLLLRKKTTPPQEPDEGGAISGGFKDGRRRVEFADFGDEQVRHSNEVAIAFVMALAISGEF